MIGDWRIMNGIFNFAISVPAKLAVVSLWLAFMSISSFSQGRFSEDVPWFRDFEEACRVRGEPWMQPECETGVLQGWDAVSGTTGGSCDMAHFWYVAEEKRSDIFEVLPWQTAVEFILIEPGVCQPGDDQ